MKWYASLFSQDLNPGHTISVDGSTRNLGWCTAPMELKAFADAFNIRPKFIISLRDPVSRIYSHHTMRMRIGSNKGPELGGVLKKNLEDQQECLEGRSKEDAIRECCCLRTYPDYVIDSI